MSINTNPDGLPDVAQLEKLANELFAALPGQFSSHGISPQQVFKSVGQPIDGPSNEAFEVANPPTSLQDPHFANQVSHPFSSSFQGYNPNDLIPGNLLGLGNSPTNISDPHLGSYGAVPPSFSNFGNPVPSIPSANGVPSFNTGQNVQPPQSLGISPTPPSLIGVGISPGSVKSPDKLDVLDLQSHLSDNKYAGTGITPPSVAGSGVSPSAPIIGAPVDLKEPQTSLPDPNYAGAGKAPQSLAGSGVSPSINYPAGNDEISKATAYQDPDTELISVLASIPVFTHIPQVPHSPIPNGGDASFYFLEGAKSVKVNEKPSPSSVEEDLANTKHKQGSIITPPFDANLIKRDFPILQEKVNGKPLIWLDNAATTQKPKLVIDRISYFYEHENSNIHRAAHELAARATDAYESARNKVKTFINAGSPNEIIFVRGATEAINLVAKSWGEQHLKAGDEIIVSHLEHHANIVPWQQLAAKKGLKIRVIPVDDDGQIILSEYTKLLNSKTKLVSVTQVSNALGTVTPAREITALAHASGAKVLIDGAQSVSHMRVDVQSLDCDWFVFSGHKVFGPTGIGVVYGKEALLNETEPWQGGGNMIVDVTFEQTIFHKAPGRFEAGTGNIADAVGLGAAIDYVSRIGIDLINQYEHYLLVYATKLLQQVPGLRLIGTAQDKASVLSFVFEGFKTEEVGAALNEEGIAVRSGHHCAQPILRRFGLEATVRPSLAFYNTCSDIDVFVETLYKLRNTRPVK